jgi:hypothetical protein
MTVKLNMLQASCFYNITVFVLDNNPCETQSSLVSMRLQVTSIKSDSRKQGKKNMEKKRKSNYLKY